MERDPLHILAEYNTRSHEVLGELVRMDAQFLMAFKLNATLLEHVNGVLGVHVIAGYGVAGGG